MSSETYKEDSFELGLIALFKEMGYTYESGYDIERDYHNAYYEPVLRDTLLPKLMSGEIDLDNWSKM